VEKSKRNLNHQEIVFIARNAEYRAYVACKEDEKGSLT
jgi:hypothetical protein